MDGGKVVKAGVRVLTTETIRIGDKNDTKRGTRWLTRETLFQQLANGLIEVVEDLMLSIGMKFGLELDYLANIMFPTRFVSSAVKKANPDMDDFGPAPNKEIEVPTHVEVNKAVSYDRFPDITPQNFMEDSKLDRFMERVLGNPSVRDIATSGQVREAATSTMALLEQSQGRSSIRGLNVEMGGLREQLWLILLNGAQHVNDDVWIRTTEQENPFFWSLIDPYAISNRYGIRLLGTKDSIGKQAALGRLLNALPLLLKDPYNDPVKTRKEAYRRLELFQNPDDIIISPQQQMAMQQGAGGPGVASSSPAFDIGNAGRSVAGRTQMQEPGVMA
jgi:hypothetical protein